MPVSGSFTAVGASPQFKAGGFINFTVSGTFVGSCQIERSFDGGATWFPLTAFFGAAITPFTAPGSFFVQEPENGVNYRLNCTAYTSGTINYRIGL